MNTAAICGRITTASSSALRFARMNTAAICGRITTDRVFTLVYKLMNTAAICGRNQTYNNPYLIMSRAQGRDWKGMQGWRGHCYFGEWLNDDGMEVLTAGRLLIRNIAMAFDEHLRAKTGETKFSKVI